MSTAHRPFRVGFVTGATPDKWAGVWRRRRRDGLELVPVEQAEQEQGLREGSLDMCLVRLPVEREGLHLIPLYREQPVVVVAKDHVVSAFDAVDLADLADEQLVQSPDEVPGWSEVARAERLDWPPMSIKDAIEVVASGTGIVVVPMSVARLHQRKDVVHVPVSGVPETQIGLAWRIDDEDERVQDFIGIVRGRTERSSRG